VRSVLIKRWAISGIAFLLLIGYFSLPANKVWLSTRIFVFINDFTGQIKNMDIEHRKELRFGAHYVNAKIIEKLITDKNIKNTEAFYLLAPSTSYFNNKGIKFDMPDPVSFYYFSGIKVVYAQNPDASKANYFIHIAQKTLTIESFRSNNQKLDSINAFKK